MANVSLKTDFKDGEKLFGQQLNNNFSVIKAALEAMNKIVWQDDPDDSVTAFRGTTEEINQRDIIDGQLLYDTSTGETYIDVGSQRISTGSGNAIHIGSDTPSNPSTQIWIDPNEPLQLIGTEVTNSMEGTESNKAPSVQAVKNYMNSKMQILWTNPNPTDDFDEQTVSLSSGDYDFYEVYCTYNSTTASQYANGFRTIKGKGLIISENGYGTDLSVRRKVDYTDATHLLISSAFGGANIDNSYLIPIYVIGYKIGGDN